MVMPFKLEPKYPFSLDPGSDSVQIIEGSLYVGESKTYWAIPYNVRVAGDTIKGDYKLKLLYHIGSNKNPESFYIGDEFNISVMDTKTSFDAIIQEVTGSDVSIAIANTGKYTANSVVVKVPEQESFSVSGVDGQMVGNLETGDYTIVGFSVIQKREMISKDVTDSNIPKTSSNKLKFDIYYTDNIGERRTVNMELPLNMNMGNSTIGGTGNFAGRKSTQSNFSWYKILVILALLIGGYFIYKKYPKKTKDLLNIIITKTKNIFKKKDSQDNSNYLSKTPEWIKNAKEKEKKK